MPVLQFHLVTSAYSGVAITQLLERASILYAAALYPEMERPPVERVRAFISDIAPDHWATGGVQVSRGGTLAPYFTCLSMRGRPRELLDKLLSDLTNLTAAILECDVKFVRGMLIELDPGDWYISGTPASQIRAAEIAARAAQ